MCLYHRWSFWRVGYESAGHLTALPGQWTGRGELPTILIYRFFFLILINPYFLPLLNASLTSNCSSALPRGLIMRGEVHFLDHCSLAETSGTFLKQATKYFYLLLTPQRSVSKLSLQSFVFICKMPCDFWPGALTTRWAHSDYSLPFSVPANYCWLQQVLGWWTLGILFFSLFSFHHFHLIVIFSLSF